MTKRIAHYHQPCPDGGWGWMVVFGSFMLHVIMDGVIYTFGLFFYAISKYFNSTKAATSMVVSIMNSVTYCSGPIASALTVKYGCRTVTIFGALLAAAGFALSVLADSIYQLYFPIGILSGFGFGLMYLPAIVIVTTWFEKRRSFATGLAVAGSGIGTMTFSPMIELIIDHLSWQAAMLIVAGLLSICVLFGALFRQVPVHCSTPSGTSGPRMRSSASVGAFSTSLKSEFDTESKCASIAQSDSHSLRSPHPMDKIDEEDEESIIGFSGSNEENNLNQVCHLLKDELRKDNSQSGSFMKCTETTSLACLEQLLSVPGTVVSLSSKGPKCATMCAKSLCSVEFNGNEDTHYDFERSRSRPHSVCPGILDRKDIFYTGSIMNIATDDDFYEVEDDDENEDDEDGYEEYENDSRITSFDEHGKKIKLKGKGRNRTINRRCPVLRWFNCPDDMLKEMSKMMDFKLLKNNVFLLFAISNFLTSIGYHIPFIFLKDRMIELGVAGEKEAGNYNAVIGLASTISRLLFGYIADHKLIRRLTLYNISITICGLVVMATPFATTSTFFYAFSALFGMTAGIYVSLTSVVLTDLLGLERLTNAFGLILLFQGVGSLVGPPLIGMLYDIYGNYDYGFVLAGAIVSISGMMLFIIDLESYFKSLKRILKFK